MKASPSSIAAIAARWMNAGTPEVVYWMTFSMIGPSAGGASSQPMRQPVIAQFFDNVCRKSTRSSGSMTSWSEGARFPR